MTRPGCLSVAYLLPRSGACPTQVPPRFPFTRAAWRSGITAWGRARSAPRGVARMGHRSTRSGIVELFLPYRDSEVTAALQIGVMERRRAMFDPVFHHLQQAKQTAVWVAQLMRVDPELMLPAALPLLAARLMDAGGVEDEPDD